MIALVRAEIRRVTSRRLFRLLLALAVLGILASGVINFATSSRDLGAARAAAEASVADCERFQEEFEDDRGFDCPTVQQIMPDLDPRFDYAATMPDVVRAIAILVALLAFTVGASSFGAEWGAGTVTTLLTWEPRRGRVLAAKVAGAAAVVAVVGAALLVTLSVVHVPAATVRGDPSGMTAGMWWTLAGVWLRGGLLCVVTSAVGLGLASVLRNTAGAVGVGFAYFAVVDPILANAWKGRFGPWTLQRLIPRFLGFPPTQAEQAFDRAVRPDLSMSRTTVMLAAYASLIVAAGYAAFRARDVN